ncbi:MAG: hypothetical protein ACYTG0_17490 [Planctomycetota bacterium]|jgi:hypothetical protein
MRLAFYLSASLTAVGVNGQGPSGHLLWLEAQQFERQGGWTADAQFIDQMGSPYLMAVGLGEPVDDAVHTRVEITNAGTDGYVVVDALQLLPASVDSPHEP